VSVLAFLLPMKQKEDSDVLVSQAQVQLIQITLCGINIVIGTTFIQKITFGFPAGLSLMGWK
jgi:hypothetical protein